MPSRHEQILAAVVTKLGTIGGVPVHRSLLRALARQDSPAFVVQGEKWHVAKRNNDLSERELVFAVKVIARGQQPDALADGYCVSAHAKVMEDQTLGGLTLLLREIDGAWAMEEADLDAVVVSMRYLCQYRSLSTTLN